MKRFWSLSLAMYLSLLPAISGAAAADSLESFLEVVVAVGPEGRGNAAAAKAWQNLSRAGAARLPLLLEAMDGANPLAANWLRSAAETIAARELEAGGSLPVAELGEFLLETRHDPRARRFAFDLISRVDAATAQALVPGMLHDPSPDLRRDAVQQLMNDAQAQAADKPEAASLIYRQALGAARDVDQISEISRLLRERGREVDLPRQLGFLMHWKVVGPFDNTGCEGFDTVYPPENEIDFAAEYDGKNGVKMRWQEYVTSDEYGMVDINQPYGMLKEVVAYACTEFVSDANRPVEIRLGSKNAWKVWLNGKLLFGRDEYHRGMRIDQYRLPAQLKAGNNTLLVKLCQDEQTQEWTVEWQFQLRICDAAGTAILSTARPPTPVAKPQDGKRRTKP